MKWQVFTALRSLQTFGKCSPPQLFTARQECLPHHHPGVQRKPPFNERRGGLCKVLKKCKYAGFPASLDAERKGVLGNP